jgi:hypothetical protein
MAVKRPVVDPASLDEHASTDMVVTGALLFKTGSAAGTPSTGTVVMYCTTTDVESKDDTGTVTTLG